MSKRIRRAVTTRDGNKICPIRYCEESTRGECRQNDYPTESNLNEYAWKWHPFSQAITTFCNTIQGDGGECERHGETRKLPHCWYDQGVEKVTGNWAEETIKTKKKTIPVFVHLSSNNMFCMPCCSQNRIRDLTLNDIDVGQKSEHQRKKQSQKNKTKQKPKITNTQNKTK